MMDDTDQSAFPLLGNNFQDYCPPKNENQDMMIVFNRPTIQEKHKQLKEQMTDLKDFISSMIPLSKERLELAYKNNLDETSAWQITDKNEEPHLTDLVFMALNDEYKITLHDFKMKLLNSILEILANRCGLIYKIFEQSDKNGEDFIIKIKCEENNLMYLADKIGFTLKLKHDSRLLGKHLEQIKLMPYSSVLKFENKYNNSSTYKKYYVTQPQDEFEDKFKNELAKARREKGVNNRNSLSYGISINDTGYDSIFRQVDRIRIINHMINGEFNIFQLIYKNIVESYIALHYQPDKMVIEKEISNWKNMSRLPKDQQIDLIKDQYGEQVSFYFAWLTAYTQTLKIPAWFGFFVWILTWIPQFDEFNKQAVMIQSLVLIMFASFFVEQWKGKQSELQVRWGVSSSLPSVRAAFKGQIKQNPQIQKYEKQYPAIQTRNKKIKSSGVTAFIIMAALAGFGGLFAQKSSCRASSIIIQKKVGLLVSGIATAVMIKVFNAIYSNIAVKLNNSENYKTEQEQNDSLVFKKFIFVFINSNAALIYIAFIKTIINDPCIDQCSGCICEESCIQETKKLLRKIIILSIVLNIVEQAIPAIKTQFATPKGGQTKEELKILIKNKQYKELKNRGIKSAKNEKSRMVKEQKMKKSKKQRKVDIETPRTPRITEETETLDTRMMKDEDEIKQREILEKYQHENQSCIKDKQKLPFAGNMDEYLEMSIQYGYVCMYGIAYPMVAFISLLNNFAEIRLDLIKLTKFQNRGLCLQDDDVGNWDNIMEIIGKVACITNVGLLILTYNVFNGFLSEENQYFKIMVIFVALEHIFLFIKWMIDSIIPDVPEHVENWISQHEDYEEKVQDNMNEEDDSYMASEDLKLIKYKPHYDIIDKEFD